MLAFIVRINQEAIRTQVRGPDQRARKANFIRPIDFLFKSLLIIVRDPLIFVPREILHGSVLVMVNLNITSFGPSILPSGQDILDFVVSKI